MLGLTPGPLDGFVICHSPAQRLQQAGRQHELAAMKSNLFTRKKSNKVTCRKETKQKLSPCLPESQRERSSWNEASAKQNRKPNRNQQKQEHPMPRWRGCHKS